VTARPSWTPGPWRVADTRSDHEKRSATYEKGWDVRLVGTPESITGWGSVTTTEANARLIAAAPDLYEALAALTPYFEGEHHPDHPHCEQARVALAKARGETP
jgi:hypothetical protein